MPGYRAVTRWCHGALTCATACLRCVDAVDHEGGAAMIRTLITGVLALVSVLPLALAHAKPAPPTSGPAAEQRLPDLDQETPTGIRVTRTGPRFRPTYRLGFQSAVRNVGDGPLIIE